jgi:hypothetical protein
MDGKCVVQEEFDELIPLIFKIIIYKDLTRKGILRKPGFSQKCLTVWFLK